MQRPIAACSCTHTSYACFNAADGIVHEDLARNIPLDPQDDGKCYNTATGLFETGARDGGQVVSCVWGPTI